MEGFEQLRELVARAGGQRIWVAGRVAVRRYLFGEPVADCASAIVPTLEFQGQCDVPAGAARLARIFNTAGARVTLAGIIGDDLTGAALLALLEAEGIDTSGVVVSEALSTEVSVAVVPKASPQQPVCELITACDIDQCPTRPRLEAMLLETLELAGREADVIVLLADTDRYITAYAAAAMGLSALDGPPAHTLQPEEAETYGTLGPTDSKLVPHSELRWMIQQVRDLGGTVAFTNGCFDLLHAGHVNYLRAAGQHGDFFVVALNSDASVARLKGPGRPVVGEGERAAVLSGLGCIDAIVLFSTDDVQPLLADLRPEVYVKGGDYTIETINQDERKLVEGYGGRIALIPGQQGASTTNILTRIRDTDARRAADQSPASGEEPTPEGTRIP